MSLLEVTSSESGNERKTFFSQTKSIETNGPLNGIDGRNLYRSLLPINLASCTNIQDREEGCTSFVLPLNLITVELCALIVLAEEAITLLGAGHIPYTNWRERESFFFVKSAVIAACMCGPRRPLRRLESSIRRSGGVRESGGGKWGQRAGIRR